MMLDARTHLGDGTSAAAEARVPRDPETLIEWQSAVNAARACLLLDSARKYHLVTGGPTVNVVRCMDLIARGRERGIVPEDAGVDEEIKALIAGGFRSRFRSSSRGGPTRSL